MYIDPVGHVSSITCLRQTIPIFIEFEILLLQLEPRTSYFGQKFELFNL